MAKVDLWCVNREEEERKQRIMDALWVRSATPPLRGEGFVPPAHPELGHIMSDPKKMRSRSVAGASVSKSPKGTKYVFSRGKKPPERR